ncbi:tetratricopeptide repeat protein [Geothrix fuzhouensis]|uniref:tetratricopeptide repeat protein n=1 Tax=Geothrix fuzhouensis TaxID=2966451 RepID=UPI002148B636|nr:tetratricopeptide repeat protein [Geothrix fuzhouensis]
MPFGSRALTLLLGFLATTLGTGSEPAGDTTIFLRYNALNGQVERTTHEVAVHHFKEARRLLEPCLSQVPDHFEAHYLLARMAYEDRDFEGALSHLDRSERSLAELDRKYRDEIAALAAQAEAEEVATQSSLDNLYARGVDPSGCSANLFQVKQSHLAFLEAKKGNIYKSENPFEIPADYHFLHGNCLYRLGRKGEAMARYRLAVRQDRAHANAWNNLISLQWEMGA